jgi:hypothetical protein
VKPSSENLLFALDMVYQAACENRSDLPDDFIMLLVEIRSKLQYLKELECE